MSIQNLISWSQKEFSELPWRKDRSLYRTLVSEIMLQQTTVSTVKNHFDRFLAIFPDLESLAKASEEELLIAWKGLGYYRRARNLKKIAEALFTTSKGEFPESPDVLESIPGIGPYTAGALVSIGMDKRALAVDANLERVIARLYGLKVEKGLKLQKEIRKLFEERKIFHEKVSFRALNEALMDLGRTICQARKASCDLCLLKKNCQAFKNGEPLKYPVEKEVEAKKKKQEHELHLLRVFVTKGDKLLVYKKAETEWLAGQYEVPTFVIKSSDKALKQYPKLMNVPSRNLLSFSTGITKYKIQNSVLLATEKEFKSLGFTKACEWKSLSCEKSNLSTATLKGLAKVLAKRNN